MCTHFDALRAILDHRDYSFSDDPAMLAANWIGSNVLAKDLLPRVRCLHLSLGRPPCASAIFRPSLYFGYPYKLCRRRESS